MTGGGQVGLYHIQISCGFMVMENVQLRGWFVMVEFISSTVKQALLEPSKYQSRILVATGSRMTLVGDNGYWRLEVQA